MKFVLPFILLSVSIAFSFFNLMEKEPKKMEDQKEKILFIGNSYTYRNKGVDQHLADLIGNGEKPKDYHITRAAKGKYHLSIHLNDSDTRSQFSSELWDKVVLQEYSSGPIFKPAEFFENGKRWALEIRKRNPESQIYLFATWKYKEVEGMEEALHQQYERLGRIINAEVIPVGKLWKHLENKINLYDGDKAHPNRKGTFATACLFYEYFKDSDVRNTKDADQFLDKDIQRKIKQMVHSFKESYSSQK